MARDVQWELIGTRSDYMNFARMILLTKKKEQMDVMQHSSARRIIGQGMFMGVGGKLCNLDQGRKRRRTRSRRRGGRKRSRRTLKRHIQSFHSASSSLASKVE